MTSQLQADVRPSDNGELLTEDQQALEAVAPENDKPKLAGFNTEPVVLWDYAFPDMAGYSRVTLFIDPSPLENEWTWVLFLEWPSGNNQSVQGTSSSYEQALQTGVDAYWQHLAEREIQKKHVSVSKIGNLALVAVTVTGVLQMPAWFIYMLSASQFQPAPEFWTGLMYLTLVVGILVSLAVRDSF